MELVVEILFTFIGAILEFLLGAVFQAVAEVFGFLFNLGTAAENRSSAIKRGAAVIAIVIAGALAGALGLWLSPELWIKSGWLRWANLLLAPLAAGVLVQLWDNWRERPETPPPALPGFVRGFAFMLIVSIMRLVWGT